MRDDDIEALVVSDNVQKLFRIVTRIAPQLAEPVYPIVGLQNATRPMPEGSCIAMQVAGRSFIATARHVAEGAREIPLGVLLPDGLFQLTGRWLLSQANLPSSHDRLDVAVLYPDEALLTHLNPAPAVDLEQIAPWHGTEATADQWPMHVFSGFPDALQPRWMKGSEYPAGVWTLAARESPISDYKSLGIDPWAHILVRFDRERVGRQDGAAVAPNPVGSSGGAIWAVVLGDDGPSARLCGLATAWLPGANQLIGTRMHVALSAIWSKSPELRDILELSAARTLREHSG